ncbi:hypothetical protein SAMN06265795_102231 [Noviherbaspirillum humi]|uniref:Uncharacterized protein n=1 Tax=Noviherbaspirillum humi TaxID=1688639 RepID=A0A239DKL6_9BURK|nr:hypothetical protein [Noviherbaspirillum humi]SNS32749.1 hypothetical protein SAMN06265795_102231 [Noviherbaspirillum humi]
MSSSPGPPKEAPTAQRKPPTGHAAAAASKASAIQFPRIAPELAADYERSMQRKRQPRWPAKMGVALLVFLIGAGAGLFGAWWGGLGFELEPIEGRAMTESEAARAAMGADASGSSAAASSPAPRLPTPMSARNGMSPSELPYDGSRHREAAAARVDPAPAPAPASAGENSSGASAVPATIQSSGDQPAEETPISPATASEQPAAAAAAATQGARQPATQARNADIKPTPVERRSAAPSKPRVSESERLAKQREIERIRRQAAEELKRKNQLQRQNEQARLRQPAPAPAKAGDIQMANVQPSEPARASARVAECEAAPNLFQREICKWQLCSGQWGKNGCPSYSKAPSAY